LSARFSIPVLYVSHSMEEIRALTGSVIRLDDGKIVDDSCTCARTCTCE
jgi:ABC-type molybdate transport system ATPase subunit